MKEENKELMEGRLCEKGLMKEEYKDGDLKRTLTNKGRLECKKALKDKECQTWFVNYLKNRIKAEPEKKDEILESARIMLMNLNDLEDK